MGFDSAGFEVGERPVHSLRQRAGRKPVRDEPAVEDNTRISCEGRGFETARTSSGASGCWAAQPAVLQQSTRTRPGALGDTRSARSTTVALR